MIEPIYQSAIKLPDGFHGYATIAEIDGRPEVVGIEVWSVHPAALAKCHYWTGMTPDRATKRWGQRGINDPPRAIRTRDMRAVKLGPLLEAALGKIRRQSSKITSLTQGSLAAPRVQAEAQRLLDQTNKRPGRPPAYTTTHYTEVARIYRAALGAGDPPTLAVASAYGVSKDLAAKWVWRCRREPLNLLPPTARGRAAAGNPPANRRGT